MLRYMGQRERSTKFEARGTLRPGLQHSMINSRPARDYIKYALIGAAIGLFLGYTGAQKAIYEHPVADPDAVIRDDSAVNALVGAIAGTLYWRFRTLRARGRLWHYLSWALAIGIGVAIVVLPQAISVHAWGEYALIVFLAAVGGLGFAFYERRAMGHDS